VAQFVSVIKDSLIDIKHDGSIWLNQDYFSYSTGLRMVEDGKWEKLFGFPKRDPESELLQCHCDLGSAIQQITEEVVLKMAVEARRLSGADYLCMAGGVALNCVANGKLRQAGIFKDMFIQPAAGDAGGALGAALAAYHIYFGNERKALPKTDGMKEPIWDRTIMNQMSRLCRGSIKRNIFAMIILTTSVQSLPL